MFPILLIQDETNRKNNLVKVSWGNEKLWRKTRTVKKQKSKTNTHTQKKKHKTPDPQKEPKKLLREREASNSMVCLFKRQTNLSKVVIQW